METSSGVLARLRLIVVIIMIMAAGWGRNNAIPVPEERGAVGSPNAKPQNFAFFLTAKLYLFPSHLIRYSDVGRSCVSLASVMLRTETDFEAPSLPLVVATKFRFCRWRARVLSLALQRIATSSRLSFPSSKARFIAMFRAAMPSISQSRSMKQSRECSIRKRKPLSNLRQSSSSGETVSGINSLATPVPSLLLVTSKASMMEPRTRACV
jgi:hypothetical protein